MRTANRAIDRIVFTDTERASAFYTLEQSRNRRERAPRAKRMARSATSKGQSSCR